MSRPNTSPGRVICAGEVMVELAALQSDEKLYRQGFAGDTYNTAVYLARAGLSVDYLTRLGEDSWSAAILAQLAREHIGTDLIVRVPDRHPGLYLIRNDSDGERQFSYWRDHSPARQLFDCPPNFEPPSLFYFSGITLAVCRGGMENLLDILVRLRCNGCRIAFDPNYRPALWQGREQAQQHYRAVLPYCHILLPTLEDEAALWGCDSIDECREFYGDFAPDELVIKAPSLTTHVFTRDGHWQRQADKVQAVDTTGAGDSFNAGYLAARHYGESIDAAIAAAQTLSASVVMQQGAILPLA